MDQNADLIATATALKIDVQKRRLLAALGREFARGTTGAHEHIEYIVARVAAGDDLDAVGQEVADLYV